MKPTVYINIGLIGTGKTTFANKMASNTPTLIVAKDSIRHMLFGQYRFDEAVESLISKINDIAIMNCLSEMILGIAPYNSLIIDECHLTKKDRLTYINMIRDIEKEQNRENYFQITYVYFQDIEGKGITRRIQEDKGLSEDHWWNCYQGQMRRIEVPTQQETKEFNVDMITLK